MISLVPLVLALLLASSAVEYRALMDEHNRAWALLSHRRADEAIAILKDLIRRDPDFWPAYSRLHEAYKRSRDIGADERFFRGLLARDPRNARAECMVGVIAAEHQQHEQAKAHFRRSVELDPYWHEPYSALIHYAFQNGESERFSSQIRVLKERDAENPAIYWAQAQLEFMNANYETARKSCAEGLTVAKRRGDRVAELELIKQERNISQVLLKSSDLDVRTRMVATADELGDYGPALAELAGLVVAYRRAGRITKSEQSEREMVARLEASGNADLQGGTLHALAGGFREIGDLARSEQLYRMSAESFRESGDLVAEAAARNYLGEVLLDVGDADQAAKEFSRGLTAADGAKADARAAFLLRALGNTHALLGEFPKAIYFQTRSVERFRKTNHYWQAGAGLGNIGDAFVKLGDYPRALGYYRQALGSARRHRDAGMEQELLGAIGRLYERLNNYPQAARHLRAALRLSGRVRQPLFDSSIHMGMARVEVERHRASEAKYHAGEALRAARQAARASLEAEALFTMGTIERRTGDVSKAERDLRQAVSFSERLGMRDLERAAREELGNAFAAGGRLRDALAEYERAIEKLESIRSRLGPEQRQARFVQASGTVYDRAIEVSGRLHEANPRGGFDLRAFELGERGRAQAFLSSLREARSGLERSLPEAVRRRLGALRAAVSRAHTELLDKGNAEARRRLEAAEQALEDFEAEMRPSKVHYAEASNPKPVSFETTLAMVRKEGVSLLGFAVGERRSTAWLITPRGLRTVVLPGRRSLERLVGEYRTLINSRPTNEASLAAHRTRGQALYRTLIGAYADRIGHGGRLVVVPDGPLHYLPFEALIAKDGKYLVEKLAITYVPSVTVWRELLSQPAPYSRQELLAFGDPRIPTKLRASIDGDGTQLVRASYESRGIRFPALPSTRQEVASIAGIYGPVRSRVYVGPNATEAALKKESLTSYRRVHFATHAVVDGEAAWRSGLILSPGGGEDGVLQLREILGLRLNAELAVLSACDTGLGAEVRGEGLVGLTRAFLHAGARRVTVSLWKVNDLATADFMRTFYASMDERHSLADALRAAKKSMLQSAVPAYRHPYYWAAFVLVGGL